MKSNLRTYSKLIQIPTFEERFDYLQIFGKVGEDTFGFDRIFNQRFYTSEEWKHVRNMVIARDLGCDLAMPGFELHGGITIHHMNPISIKDIQNSTEILLNPEYLITTSSKTHRAIHYGDSNSLLIKPTERTKNDTCPWKE